MIKLQAKNSKGEDVVKYFSENHVVRIQREKHILNVYATNTLNDRHRYEPFIFNSEYLAEEEFDKIKMNPKMILIGAQIFGKNQIITLQPIVNMDIPTIQLRVTTAENAQNKKRRYQVFNYVSEARLGRELSKIITEMNDIVSEPYV